MMACILVSVFLLVCCGHVAGKDDREPVTLKILAINDFHGHMYDGQELNGRPAGSAPLLASHLNRAMEGSGASATVIALLGDTIGASPRSTALLMDEPSVLFFNGFAGPECGSKNGGVSRCNMIEIPGNHEFNRGTEELLRMTYGGNSGVHVPPFAGSYPGSLADAVCANVVWKENNTPILPPYTIREVDGVPVAFIGAVTTETTVLELPQNIENVKFLNESEAINLYVAELQDTGIHSFVILIHNGGNQEGDYDGLTRQGGNVTGPIVSIVSALDEDVDVVLSAHSHDFTNAFLKNAGGKEVLVTQAYAYGVAYADVDLIIDTESGDIIQKSAAIVPVYADEPAAGDPDPAASALVADIQSVVSRLDGDVIAIAASDITRDQRFAGGSALGMLVADSQRAAMGADVAFVTSGMSAGSLHSDIDEGEITWADLEAVLPPDASMAEHYGGWYSRPHVAVRDLNGEQIKGILEKQWAEPAPEADLSVSGIEYRYDLSRPAGDRVTEMRINGEPVMTGSNYTAAMDYYMAYGMGDFAPAWDWGDVVTVGPADIDALISYIRSRPAKWTR